MDVANFLLKVRSSFVRSLELILAKHRSNSKNDMLFCALYMPEFSLLFLFKRLVNEEI